MRAKLWVFFILFAAYTYMLTILWWQKKLSLFLHPDFIPLAIGAAIILLIITFALLFQRHSHVHALSWWKTVFLLLPIVVVTFVPLRPLSSSTALTRGINSGVLSIGRKVNAMQFASNPAKRTLYQWVIALNANPEPTHYDGQPVNIKGFILHDPALPSDQVLLARFIVTCCAADARVLSLPIQKTSALANAKDDQWFAIKGKMVVVESNGQRSLLVQPDSAEQITEPDDPYEI
jgi:uncharacterized repeat protein (TIGR03943 family)